MADDRMQIRVSVEEMIHDSIQRFVQTVRDEHKVEITSISIDWTHYLEVARGEHATVKAVDVNMNKVY